MYDDDTNRSPGHENSNSTLHIACRRLLDRCKDHELEPERRQVILEEAKLIMNTHYAEEEDIRECYPGACISWIREQSRVSTAAAEDGLAFAIEFLDPRPDDAGGWIRMGTDADGQLRYSCDGVVRPPFKQAIWAVSGRECYISFPDIERGLVLCYGKHTADVLLPSMRALFDEAGVNHNIPCDAELASYLVASPCSSICFRSPRHDVAQQARRAMREADCDIIGCAASRCAVM